MVKIYVMSTCPDCTDVKQWAEGDERFQIIDMGIPAFVKEDGTVTFKAEEVGLVGTPVVYETGASCNIDGSGCRTTFK